MKVEFMKKTIVSMLDELDERQVRLVYWFIMGMRPTHKAPDREKI